MTAGIAHDFRNILAVIDSGLRLAEKGPNDGEKLAMYVAGARDGVARGLALTSQLLSFASQREGELLGEDANELLRDLDLFLRYGAGSNVRVALDLASDIPRCVTDRSRFNAAILNLVVNARDAMPNGGEIRISTKWAALTGVADATAGNYVCVRISDDGLGMAEKVLENIFQPFFTTKGEHGTGLGIPQVGAFMRYVGGHVRVASEMGQGTTFDLFFRPSAPTAPTPETRPRNGLLSLPRC
jgi:signal transduction histidine kinase